MYICFAKCVCTIFCLWKQESWHPHCLQNEWILEIKTFGLGFANWRCRSGIELCMTSQTWTRPQVHMPTGKPVTGNGGHWPQCLSYLPGSEVVPQIWLNKKYRNLVKLGSVVDPVIRANGRLSFEDDLRSGDLLYCADSMVTLGEPRDS